MSMIGRNLGHYTLSTLIGRGGMGEVYQAKDQKLGRDVAIKVLPEEFAKDADRVARFQREAKLLASLNHPNIASIYGLEESDGTHFLVLELIEGDTLADRLKRGAIPVEESLKLALQIAEALEAAHEKGVIHRDLKPANIKVTPDGKAKVLDFGLAKAFAGDSEDMDLSNSPTLSVAATQHGIILGTAAYMSPEQASGEATDKRADVWAFGVVLYEMLTGRSLFEGNNVSQTLASVIKSEPEWKSLPPNLHPRIRFLLERCLEKEPGNRYHDIADVRVDIQKVLVDPSGIFAQPLTTAKPRKKLRLGLPWVAAILAAGAIITGVAVWKLKPTDPRRVVSFDYDLPAGQGFNIGSSFGHTLAVSPDGRQFIYSTRGGLYLRSEEELEARIIPGTDDDPQSPFFSADGQFVGYWSQADGKLKKIAIRGGAPVALCDVTWVYGAIWYADNTIVYADIPSGIKRVSANGGTPETLVEGLVAAPQLLAEGKALVFTDVSSQPYRILAQSLESGERKELFAGTAARYLSTGHLVYLFEDNLYAVAFDPDILEVRGGQAPLVEGVGFFAVSDSGTLVYQPQTAGASSGDAAGPQRTLVWVDREGKEKSLSAPPGDYQFCKISPDGKKIALGVSIDGNSDIRIWDTFRKNLMRLTFDEAEDSTPLWTPDGQRVVFTSTREREFGGVFWKMADGTGGVERLCSVPDRAIAPWSWSGDGSTLVLFEATIAPLNLDIATLSMEGDRERKGLLQEKHLEVDPQVSPDGRWLAYTSNESGREEIFVRPFPDVQSGGRWQVSTDGGISPLWSPDGKELFYRSGDATMAVPVETDPTFSPGNPKILFRKTYFSVLAQPFPVTLTPWDIHPDGKKFLMIKTPETAAAESATEEPASAEQPKIIVVLNWTEELKERVPAD